jgi:hypothetical protein
MSMNRTADGKLTHDPVRFPSGMKALANYVQGKGLKVSTEGALSCCLRILDAFERFLLRDCL